MKTLKEYVRIGLDCTIKTILEIREVIMKTDIEKIYIQLGEIAYGYLDRHGREYHIEEGTDLNQPLCDWLYTELIEKFNVDIKVFKGLTLSNVESRRAEISEVFNDIINKHEILGKWMLYS